MNQALNYGFCRLCFRAAPLQHSHIIPSFVIRWFRKSSSTGHMRVGRNPNRREQDGPKYYWFCGDCEELLGKQEKSFAEKLFGPWTKEGVHALPYREWLMRFAVSLSFRSTLLLLEDPEFLECESWRVESAEAAKETWRRFLLGETTHLRSHQQHVIPLDEHFSFPKEARLPPTTNRYFLRGIDLDAVWSGPYAFCFTKIPRLAIVGFWRIPDQEKWKTTKIYPKSGRIGGRTAQITPLMAGYLLDRAHKAHQVEAQISEAQRKASEAAFERAGESAKTSDSLRAFQADYGMFGDEVWKDTPDG